MHYLSTSVLRMFRESLSKHSEYRCTQIIQFKICGVKVPLDTSTNKHLIGNPANFCEIFRGADQGVLMANSRSVLTKVITGLNFEFYPCLFAKLMRAHRFGILFFCRSQGSNLRPPVPQATELLL